MKRVDRFRQIRRTRKRCLFTLLFSFLLFVSGVFIVDCSLNDLMNKKSGMGMVYIKQYGDYYYEIDVLGKSIALDTQYIIRDIAKVKDLFEHKDKE
jgi:hypothetical protein